MDRKYICKHGKYGFARIVVAEDAEQAIDNFCEWFSISSDTVSCWTYSDEKAKELKLT